jgi:putative sterol carrier protein
LVIEVNVAGGPEAPAAGAQDGTAPVCYQVALWAEGARVLYGPEGNLEADVRLSVDYQTLAAVASGVMPPLEAMFSGRARIAGGTTALSAHQSALEPLDLVPAAVRASTTF